LQVYRSAIARRNEARSELPPATMLGLVSLNAPERNTVFDLLARLFRPQKTQSP
jgi:hypothetical protein